MQLPCLIVICFFFNDTATTEIYTLSLHDALPISQREKVCSSARSIAAMSEPYRPRPRIESQVGPHELKASIMRDRKSTRLNSSHANISYAVFCLKKKKQYSHIPPLSYTIRRRS